MTDKQANGSDAVASQAAGAIALQMLEERGRGAVLVGVARVDAALEHLLQAVMAQAPARGDGLFLPDRPLGSLGAKVALARRLGLIDAPVERALSALRKLRNAFADSAESASLADSAHSARLAEIYAEAHTNPLWAPLETVLAAQPPSAHGPLEPALAGLHPADHDPGGFPGGHGPAAQALSAASSDGLLWGHPPGADWMMPLSETFRVLKNNEIRQFGEYRTQRLVLEAWDRLFGGG